MPKAIDLIDRGCTFIFQLISMRTALLAAVAFYTTGLALPLSLHWPTYLLIAYNLTGTVLGLGVIVGWLAIQLQAAHRRHLVDWTTRLRLLNAEEFEWFVGEIFRREGYQVSENGSQERPDGNVDLVLAKDGIRIVVQCKRWQAQSVGVDEIRKFAGTLMREGLTGKDGIFVTLSNFTSQAQAEAKTLGVLLIDGAQLDGRRQKVRRGEACPVCGKAMLFDRSVHGWWFRCLTAGCSGKRDLGIDEGRALELLLN